MDSGEGSGEEPCVDELEKETNQWIDSVLGELGWTREYLLQVF